MLTPPAGHRILAAVNGELRMIRKYLAIFIFGLICFHLAIAAGGKIERTLGLYYQIEAGQ